MTSGLWLYSPVCDRSGLITYFFFFFFSVLRPFQEYFSSYETGQSVGGRKLENPEKNHPQAELGLSHMWPARARTHTRHSGEMMMIE